MAYIDCPQCGQSALSVATRCPRCGFGFTQHRLRYGHQPRPAGNKIPLWVGGGLVILVVVFLLGEGGNGAVTVPPIAGGLDEQPAEVVVQIDTGMVQPAGQVPPDTAANPTMAVSAGKLDTVPPIRATAPAESRPLPDPVVVTIVPLSAEADAADNAKLLGGGPAACRRVGIISGGAGDMIADAVAAGCDTFITGEGAHHTYFDAHEWGINVIYAGHYATEQLGVQALAAVVSERFDIPWVFHDHPTGL